MNKDIVNLISNGIQETFEEDREKILSFIKETFNEYDYIRYLSYNVSKCRELGIKPFGLDENVDLTESYENLMKINKQEVDKLSNDRVRCLLTLIEYIKSDEMCNMDKKSCADSITSGFFFDMKGNLVIF